MIPISVIDLEEISLDSEKSPRLKPNSLAVSLPVPSLTHPTNSSIPSSIAIPPPSSLSSSAQESARKEKSTAARAQGRRLLSSRFCSRVHGKRVTGDEIEIYQLLNAFFDDLTKVFILPLSNCFY
jgi:hypothetical protein